MFASPGDVGGVGKLERASRKGGMLASSCPVPVPGCIDLMPTMIMGTILPSPSSSPCAPPLPDPLPRLPVVSSLPFSVDVPNLNILKKLSGAWPTPGISPPCPSSLPRNADAMLPFCRDWRNVSNVPSRVAAWLSSPTNDAAVAAAASESSLDSTSAWSSPCRSCCTLSMFSPSCHNDRLLRGCPIILRSRRCEGIMLSALPSRLCESKIDGRRRCESCRSVCECVRSSWSKSSPSSGTCTRGRNDSRSLAVCLRAERPGVLRLPVLNATTPGAGSVLRACSDGRLCSSPVMELSEERARFSRVRERLGSGGGSSGADGPASGRPKCAERRLLMRFELVLGRGGVSCTLCSSSGTASLSGCDEPSSPGAQDSGRALRRVCGSEEPLEFACPMSRGRPARKARLEREDSESRGCRGVESVPVRATRSAAAGGDVWRSRAFLISHRANGFRLSGRLLLPQVYQ
jgi:hypothetical protein